MDKKSLLPFTIFPALLLAAGGWQLTTASPLAGFRYSNYAALLPVLTIGLTIAFILLCLMALRYLRGAGKKALISREHLYETFSRAKKILPFLIMMAFFCLLLALICVGIYEFLDWHFVGDKPKWREKVAVSTLIIGGMIWFAFFRQARNTYKALSVEHPFVLKGMALTENDAPKLFALIKRLARDGGFILPDTVLAGFNDGFFVFEDSAQLDNGQQIPFGKVLHLSIPFMVYFDEAELNAVLGHELAHLTDNDTEYQRKFSKEFRRLHIAFAAMTDLGAEEGSVVEIMTRPFVGLAEEFLHTFDLADKHWSRAREFAADKNGARVGSGMSCSIALLRISAFGPAIDEVISAYYSCNARQEESILEQLAGMDRNKARTNLEELLDWEQPHPTDTHPTLKERMDQFGIRPDAALIKQALAVNPGKLLRDLGIY